MSTFQQSFITGADGVPLAVFDSRPAAGSTGPTLFLVNGLGGNITTWEFLVAAFRERHRIVTWDYRGLYASKFDPDTRERFRRGQVPVGIDAHAGDALRVLDHLGIDRAVFVGWSMGVQLNFELWRAVAPRVAGFVQICGAPGRALTTTVFGPVGRSVIPPAMEVFRQAADRYAPWLGRVASSPTALAMAKKAGFVAPTLDEKLAVKIIQDYMHLDFEVYNRILLSLGDHDATPLLSTIDRPTLVVAGTRDPMTPLTLSRRMVEMLPQGELTVFEGGSHYVPIEFPTRLNQALADFLSRRVTA
jgi:pimeloyl-ACP methyl ester carboxylesterase